MIFICQLPTKYPKYLTKCGDTVDIHRIKLIFTGKVVKVNNVN